MMDSQEEEKRIYATKQEVLDRVKELAQEENPSKQEIDHLKVAFYHLLNTEREAQQKAYIEAGVILCSMSCQLMKTSRSSKPK